RQVDSSSLPDGAAGPGSGRDCAAPALRPRPRRRAHRRLLAPHPENQARPRDAGDVPGPRHRRAHGCGHRAHPRRDVRPWLRARGRLRASGPDRMARIGRWLPALVALTLPLWLSTYPLHVAIMAGIFGALALSLNLLLGYTGHLSLGHAAFFGIGAYPSALLTLRLEWSFWLALPCAVAASGLAGWLIGRLALKLRGAYFVLVTISFAGVIAALAGMAGSLYAHYTRFVSPEVFLFSYTVTMVIMVVAGGKGTLAGPLVGALIFTALPEVLRAVTSWQWQMLAYGVLLVLL